MIIIAKLLSLLFKRYNSRPQIKINDKKEYLALESSIRDLNKRRYLICFPPVQFIILNGVGFPGKVMAKKRPINSGQQNLVLSRAVCSVHYQALKCWRKFVRRAWAVRLSGLEMLQEIRERGLGR